MNIHWLRRIVAELRGSGSKQRRRRLNRWRRATFGEYNRSLHGIEMLEGRRLLVASLAVDDPMVVEGDGGEVNLNFTVTRSGDDISSNITFSYSTSDNSPVAGAATAGSDYTAISGTATIPSGSSSATISVPVLGDSVFEGNEQLFLNLTGITNVTGPDVTLAVKQDFATGLSPRSVTVGDLNGDGRLDLAVANLDSNTISVLLNTTAPGATVPAFAKHDLGPVASPRGLAIGDLNEDGLFDLAVANFSAATVSVLLNTTPAGSSTPTFSTAQSFTTGVRPISVTVADLNGDGRSDLAVANLNSNTVSVLLNTTATGAGTSTFATKQDLVTGAAPRSVTAADLNGDGRPDLAVANYNSLSASVLLNTTAPGAATPTFASKQDFAAGSHPMSVTAGDLNGDGRPDLAVANYGSSTLSVLFNTTSPGATTPTFAAKQDFATGSRPYSVAVGDFNGDGRPDLTVANSVSNTVSVLLNTTAPGEATPSLAAKQDFATGNSPYSVTVGDLNGDGRLDLALANAGSNSASVLLNTTILPGNPGAMISHNQGTGTIMDNDIPVNLSVSANSGSESGTTVITVTATASAAVNSDQTVTLDLSGDAIHGSDYTLSDTTITILNGMTEGSVTFTVKDDLLNEGDEVATLAISNPSSGIMLGTTTIQIVTITDDDDAGTSNYGLPVAGVYRLVRNAGAIEIYNGGKTLVASRPIGTDPVVANGTTGDDILIVDFGGGNFPVPIAFNGGAQASTPGDSLALTGGTFATGTFTFNNSNDGTIDLTGNSQISYTGLLEPIDTTSATINNLNFTFNGGGETITLTDAVGAAMTIDSTLGESVTFANPIGSLRINAGTGDDTVTISSVDTNSPFNAALTINDGLGTDTINFNADLIAFAGGQSLIVTAESVNVGANADIATSGTGTIAITSDDITLNPTATLVSASTVTLRPQTASRAITLGTEVSGQLSLTDAELDRITADTLVVGDGYSGTISVSADLSQPARNLSLTTGVGVTGSGAITNGSPTTTTVTIDQAGDSTYHGQLGGPSSGTAGDVNLALVKSGSGVLTLAGANTYTGATLVNAGTLVVSGAIASGSALSVVDGAALAGGGAITGSVRLAPGARLATKVHGTNPGIQYEQLDVIGSVSLSDSLLEVDLNYVPQSGDQFTIINNDGSDPVIGTFAGLPQGGFLQLGGHSFQIDYQSGDGDNDVQLRAVVTPQVTLISTDRSVAETARIVTLVAELAQPLDADAVVPVRILVGTATEGVDYRLLTTHFAFPAQETTATFDIEILDDRSFEGPETFMVALDTTSGVLLGANVQNIFTIIDDDPLPSVRFASRDQTIEEGQTAAIEVSLTASSALDVTVPLVFGNISTRVDDFSFANTSITIPAGQMRGGTSVTINDDALAEGQEMFVVLAKPPVNATLSSQPNDPRFHAVTIQRNDAPSISFAAAFQERWEDAGNVSVQLRLSNPSSVPITIPFTVGDNGPNIDWIISPSIGITFAPDENTGTITFAPGDTSRSVNVTINNDLIYEHDESVYLSIGNLGGRTDVLPGNTLSHTLRIIDNDSPIVAFKTRSQSVWENAGTVVYEVTLSQPSAVPITVPITVSGTGNLSSGYATRTGSTADFTTLTSSITFQVNPVTGLTPSSITRSISIVNDTVTEDTEQIVIGLGTPTGGAKLETVPTKHDVLIKDDDPLVSISRSTGSVTEDNSVVSFTISLSAPTHRQVTVPFTVGGKATKDKDYSVSPSISVADFDPGESSKRFVVAVKEDLLDEIGETITWKLRTPTGGASLRTTTSATITINDDDGIPSVSWEKTKLQLSESVAHTAVRVTLSKVSGKDVLVPISFKGSATRNEDYTISGLANGRLLIPAGETSNRFVVNMEKDKEDDDNETIEMYIGNPTNAKAPSINYRDSIITIVDGTRPPKSKSTAVCVSNGNDIAPRNYTFPPQALAIPTEIVTPECGFEFGSDSGLFSTSSASDPTVLNSAQGTLAIGIGSNGLFQGTTAFYDANFNGVLDFLDFDANGTQDVGEPNEPSTTTAIDGSFAIVISGEFDRNDDGAFGPDEGRWVLAGGVDTSIELPLRTYLTASQGHYVVTPLSTLAEVLVRRFDKSLAEAELHVLESFGLEGINFAQSNPIQGAAVQDEVAAAQEAISVKLSNVVLQIADLFAGLDGALSTEIMGEIVYTDIAEKIREAGSSMDLGIVQVIRNIITGVSISTGLTLDSDPASHNQIITDAATVITAGNQAIDDLENTGDMAYVTEVTRIKKVMQSQAAPALRDVSAGNQEIADVVSQFTGTNLIDRIATATVGLILPPSVGVGNGSVLEENVGIAMLTLPVELTGDHPHHSVTVQYSTMDDSATVGADYTPVSGTLTWEPGDNTPRTIEVPIHGDTLFETAESLRVVLSDAVHAMIRSVIGYGFILNDDALDHATAASLEPGENLIEIGLSKDELLLFENGELLSHGEVVNPLDITIHGQDNVNDNLTLDLGSDIVRSDVITFHGSGGTGFDSVEVVGETFEEITHILTNATDGQTLFKSADSDALVTFSWTGLEPFLLNVGDVTNLVFELPPGVTNSVLEDADPTDADPALVGKLRLRSPDGHFETTLFPNPLNSLTIRGGNGADSITIGVLDPAFDAALTIDGDALGSNAVDLTVNLSAPGVATLFLANGEVALEQSGHTYNLGIPSSITIQGIDAGDDTLIVDFVGGSFPVPITFNGGAQASTPGDSLILTGGTFATGLFTLTNNNDGTIDLTGNSQISYIGLEPIVTTGMTIDNLIFTFNGGAETITLTDAVGAAMTIDSTLGESVTFANPIGSLRINAGTGDDTVTISSVDTDVPFNAALTINGGLDADTVELNADAIILASGKDLIVTAQTVNVGSNADLATSDTGTISFMADDITIHSTATLVSASTVTLRQQTANRPITLGTEVGGQLSLTGAELDRITAQKLAVGDGYSGPITVSADINFTDGPVIPTLRLETGSMVTANSGGIVVSDLAVNAGGAVAFGKGTANATNLAISAGDAVLFLDATGLAIAAVDGINGISTSVGSLYLRATAGNVSVADTLAADDLYAPTGVTLESGGTITVFGTVNGGMGTVGLNAWDDIMLSGANADVTTSHTYQVSADNDGNGTGTYRHDSGAAVNSSSGAIIQAADIELAGTINAGSNSVSLRPLRAGTTIGIGSPADFSLSIAELANISASRLGIGNFNVGAITIGESLVNPAGANTLSLLTGAGVSQIATASINVANLAIRLYGSGSAVLDSAPNDVDRLAIWIQSTGDISYHDMDGLAVDSVDGVRGISAPLGSVLLTLDDGDLAIADTIAALDVFAGSTVNFDVRGNNRLLTVASGARIESGLNGGANTFSADKMRIDGTVDVPADASLLLTPNSAGKPIDLGSTSDTSANTLELSDSELDRISAGALVIGTGDSGAITVSADLSQPARNLSLTTSAGVTGSGAIINGSATTTTVTIDQAGDSTYGGQLGGPSGVTADDKNFALVKLGSGELTLSGSNAYRGTTFLNAGTLLVNGSIASHVVVTSPAILGGSGHIAGDVSGNGTVSPGSSAGIFTVLGSFTPSGTVAFDVNQPYAIPGVDYDQIIVGGTVDLSAATLAFAGGTAPTATAPALTVIRNDSAASTTPSSNPGEGATITLGSAVLKIAYNNRDGNDVVLKTNDPPTADAGGPYSVAEGCGIVLDASASSDPNQGSETLTYEWDFDGDGQYDDATGATPDFSTVGLDGPSSAVVSLRVTDSGGLTSMDAATVNVTNVAPSGLSLSLGSTSIDENGSTTLSGKFSDPGRLDTHTLTIDWGDGSANTVLYLAAGVLSIPPTTHQYVDDGPSPGNSTAADTYAITVTVIDDDAESGSGSTNVTVNNVAPQNVNAGADQTVYEGDTVSLSGSFHELGTADTHTQTWSVTTSNGQAVSDGSGASFSFVPTDNGTYAVTFTVTDDDNGTTSDTVLVTVNNVAPVLLNLTNNSLGCGGALPGQEITFQGSFTDIGSGDTHAAIVDWGDGTTSPGRITEVNGARTIAASHTYATGGLFAITVTLTDDDQGAASGIISALIAGVQLRSDGTLLIIGSDGRDDVEVDKHRGSVRVRANATDYYYALSSVQWIKMRLCGGDDQGTIATNLAIPALLDGGDGNDHLRGGAADDELLGGAGDDKLSSDGGNDTLRGGDGDDELRSGRGNDFLYGDSGNDRIYGDGGNDLLDGGLSDDVLYAGKGGDAIYGGDGNDRIYGGSGSSLIYAGAGDDVIHGGSKGDTIDAGPGDDYVVSGSGNDTIFGGDGNDEIDGDSGHDWIDAGDGNDFVEGGSGDDTIFGGNGNDEIDSGSGDDWVDSGDGNDSVEAGSGDDLIRGGIGNDRIDGGSGDDILTGGDGEDILIGGAGRDLLIGGFGADWLLGNSGDDILVGGRTTHDNTDDALKAIVSEWRSFRSYSTRLANLRNGTGSANRANGSYFLNDLTIENDLASDVLTGLSGQDWLLANAGQDQVTDRASNELTN